MLEGLCIHGDRNTALWKTPEFCEPERGASLSTDFTFPSIKGKGSDTDKWDSSKLFVVANVKERDQPSTVAVGHCLGPGDTGLRELSADDSLSQDRTTIPS